MNFGIRHLLVLTSVLAVFLSAQQLKLDLVGLVIATVVIASIVGVFFGWSTQSQARLLLACFMASCFTSVCFAFDYLRISQFSTASMGSIESLLIAISGNTIFATVFGALIGSVALHFKPWVVLNEKAVTLVSGFVISFAFVGVLLSLIPAIGIFAPHSRLITGMVMTGAMMGTAWAQWLIGFKSLDRDDGHLPEERHSPDEGHWQDEDCAEPEEPEEV